MRELKATDWYEIKGRGKVAVIDQMPEDEYDPNNFEGQTVLIDGKQYTVAGVESFAIGRSREHPYRLGFGLLVQ